MCLGGNLAASNPDTRFAMEAMSKIFKTTRLNLDFPYNNVNLTKLAQKPIAEYDESIDKLIKAKESPM